jgi:hypothetical protein
VSARRTSLFVVSALVLAGALAYSLFAHRSPEGQPPLVEMNLATFKADFNRASNRTRLILLLSPT